MQEKRQIIYISNLRHHSNVAWELYSLNAYKELDSYSEKQFYISSKQTLGETFLICLFKKKTVLLPYKLEIKCFRKFFKINFKYTHVFDLDICLM